MATSKSKSRISSYRTRYLAQLFQTKVCPQNPEQKCLITFSRSIFYILRPFLVLFNPNLGVCGGYFLLPCWFSLNNLEMVKAAALAFAVFSNILLETFVPNLVFLTRPSLQILGKNSDGGICDFQISGQSLIRRNCHNS